MQPPLFELDHVSLALDQQPSSLGQQLRRALRGRPAPERRRSILTDICLSIEPGERVGIAGPNGAGKSSLIRLLAGIYPPTSGSIAINCAPYGLMAMSQGILPKATGLDNIYLKGLSLGMRRDHIRKITPQIVRFSGLGADIRRPVETYSAGMRLRLNVAISLSVDADVILMDEWIGAGDEAFKAKIDQRLTELLGSARGLVIASHNRNLLNKHCTRILHLKAGRLVKDRPVIQGKGIQGKGIQGKGVPGKGVPSNPSHHGAREDASRDAPALPVTAEASTC